jgi:hypothetical protein
MPVVGSKSSPLGLRMPEARIRSPPPSGSISSTFARRASSSRPFSPRAVIRVSPVWYGKRSTLSVLAT